MRVIKQQQNVRLLPFLPYGICSKYATALTGKTNPYAHKLHWTQSDDDVLSAADVQKREAQNRARNLHNTGLAKDVSKPCGTPVKDRIFRQLTKAGVTCLLDLPDAELINIGEEQESTEVYDGEIKGTHYRSQSTAAIDMRDDLYDLATNPDQNAQALFQSYLLDSVKNGHATPFAAGLKYADSLKVSTSNLSQNHPAPQRSQTSILSC